jgi:hypothetical protein
MGSAIVASRLFGLMGGKVILPDRLKQLGGVFGHGLEKRSKAVSGGVNRAVLGSQSDKRR